MLDAFLAPYNNADSPSLEPLNTLDRKARCASSERLLFGAYVARSIQQVSITIHRNRSTNLDMALCGRLTSHSPSRQRRRS